MSNPNLIIDGWNSKIVEYYSMPHCPQMVSSVLMDAVLVRFLQSILIDNSLFYSFLLQDHEIALRLGLHLFELSEWKIDETGIRFERNIVEAFLELTLKIISTNSTATDSIFCIFKVQLLKSLTTLDINKPGRPCIKSKWIHIGNHIELKISK